MSVPELSRRARLPSTLLLLGAAVLSGGGPAAGAEVRVVLKGGGPSGRGDVVVIATRVPVDGDAGREVKSVARDEEAVLDLSLGTWSVTARAPGLWSPRHLLVVTRSDEKTAFDMRLWPTTRVTGAIRRADRKPLPQSLRHIRVGFESPSIEGAVGDQDHARESDTRILRSEVACPVTSGRWVCELPMGTLDVRLRASGFVPEYRWALRVGGDGPAEPFFLRRAASVVGHVRDTALHAIGEASVELRSGAGEPIPASDGRSAAMGVFATVTNSRGFFQLVGMPPGQYQLRVRHPKFTTNAVRIEVIRQAEASLAKAIVLAPPATLDVYVNPTHHPEAEPWRVRLMAAEGGRFVAIDTSPPLQDGHWRKEGVAVGRYLLSVIGPDGLGWFAQEIDLEPTSGPMHVEVPVARLRGNITLGDKPLPARVTFGGRRGVVRIPFQADDEGLFEGPFPAPADKQTRWEVYVQARLPRVERTVEAEVVPGPTGLEVSIHIPLTRLRGTIVQEDGLAFGGSVLVTADHVGGEESLQSIIAPENHGAFTFEGLPPGRYRLMAEARGLTSDPAEAVVPKSGEAERAKLVLKRSLDVEVVLRSHQGEPVPGASVKAQPVPLLYAPVSVRSSDQDGRVALVLPPGTKTIGLGVGAVGFSYTIGRTAIQPGQPVSLQLQPLGGELVVILPAPEAHKPNAFPFLLHNGFYEGVSYLERWAVLNGGGRSADRLAIPQMSSGDYTLCLIALADVDLLLSQPARADDLHCVRGTLYAGSSLELKLEASEAK